MIPKPSLQIPTQNPFKPPGFTFLPIIILQLRSPFTPLPQKMQVNQEQTPYPPSLQSYEEAIIEQVLRLSLEIENARTYCETNGLPHRYRKLIKNMKMGKSKQQCTVCMQGYLVDEPIKRFPCGHIFHSECARQWLKVNRRCPVCRLDLQLHFQTLEKPQSSKLEQSLS